MPAIDEKEPQKEAEPVAMDISATQVKQTSTSNNPRKCCGSTALSFLGGMVGAVVVAVVLLSLHGAGYLQPLLGRDDEAIQQERDMLLAAQQVAANRAEEATGNATQALTLADDLAKKNDSLNLKIMTVTQDLIAYGNQLADMREGTDTDFRSLDAQLTALAQGLSALENTVQEQKKLMESQNAAIIAAVGGEGDENFAARMGVVDARIASLGQVMEQLEGELRAQRTILEGQKSEIDHATRDHASTQNSLTRLQGDVQSLNDELKALPVITEQAASNQNMARLIAANALKAAVERGGSYKNELQIFAAVVPQNIPLDMLEATAEAGLPNAAVLSASFASVADKIAATEKSLGRDASWNERIAHKVQELYTQRPVGNVEGTNAAAIAARMEVAITEGDYTRALQEWEGLTEEAKAVSSNFMAQLRARQAVDTLLVQLIAHSLGQEE